VIRFTFVFALYLACVVTTIAQETTPAPRPVAEPKKANQRPANTASAAEPFDGATAKAMAEKCVKLETEAGEVEIELLPEAAPEAVRNFLNLVAISFYDTTAFSRVVKSFVVQGGNLATRQTRPPELTLRAQRTIPDEPSYVKHVRGIVSMARPDAPNSVTTNFFILVSDSPHLDGTFTAFGRVTRGMETVDAINSAPTENEKPLKPVRLTRALIIPCAPVEKLPN